uniref:Beta-glucuronidase n=1 Tax=Cacopsylla melanoneura TaxID=428564 RepID=A0A8D8WC93_9HEMI
MYILYYPHSFNFSYHYHDSFNFQYDCFNSFRSYNDQLLREHKRILDKMIGTHRTRANVIMWSIANEPTNTTRPDAVNYFKELAFHVKELDPTRPSILITGEFAHRNASTSAVSLRDNMILKKVFVYKS